jgi:DNA-binding NarL/FixJ family response regulator
MRVPHLTDDDSQAPRVRVLVGLHDTLITDAFALLLREAGFQVAICSGEPMALLEQAVQSSHDVIIIGSDVVAADGTSPTLAQLRLLAPSTRIVVLLRDGDELCARVLLQHAVNGVVLLNARANGVVAILRQVLDGQVVYPSLLIERYAAAPETHLLSERQREVLEQLALGRSNDEIARRLYISRNTVKFHLREIYSRLGVRNRVEATRAAQSAQSAARRDR